MLRFEIETEDADWWTNVYKYDTKVGVIYHHLCEDKYLFRPLDYNFGVEDLTIIAGKMTRL